MSKVYVALMLASLASGVSAHADTYGMTQTLPNNPSMTQTLPNTNPSPMHNPSSVQVTGRTGIGHASSGVNDGGIVYVSPGHNFTVASGGNTPDAMNSIFDKSSQTSWFAFASGIASILGLMFTLYGTQIRMIPFSLYRSCVWNRVLLISIGIGILVFAGIKFYTQTEPPGLPPLSCLFMFLHGVNNFYTDIDGNNGTNLWAIIFAIGAVISTCGFFYNPIKLCKSVLRREHDALLEYRKTQLSSVLNRQNYENLKSHEKHLYDDLNAFHVELQTRLIDTIYGQSLMPTYSRRMKSHIWPNKHIDETD